MNQQLFQLVLTALVLMANMLSGLILWILKGVRDNQRRLWEDFDRHRLNRDIHPDADRIRRIEQHINGQRGAQ